MIEESSEEQEPIWLSMLEHYAYCPRQFALIHIEQIYDDNLFTLEGTIGHERVNEQESNVVNGIRCERSLPVFSDRRGLNGIADLVEFPNDIPYPVEYKRSWRKGRKAAEVQLCAQAICLEEMFGVDVPLGAIYSIKSHKRFEIGLTLKLRDYTFDVIRDTRVVLSEGITPPAVYDSRCKACSLIEACLPDLTTVASSEAVSKKAHEVYRCKS
ncbi:MAG: CRISPR-associated protein Cas4 [Candidatus Hatepunaea meridiana]|nr:CRISPR-associated protein Cas4 [Candidatus Hatepunaea meridiana]